MIRLRYSGGRFTQIETAIQKAVEDRALGVEAAGLSEQAAADAVEQVLLGEPDRGMSITFPQKP